MVTGQNGVILVRVEHEGNVGFFFLTSLEANVAFWSGKTNNWNRPTKVGWTTFP